MKQMRMFSVVVTCIGLALAAASESRADPIIYVYASSAPNAFGSPSYTAWQNNVLVALQQPNGQIGNPATDPAAFLQVSQMNDTGNIVSQFTSWQGQANPSGNFANEFGNRLMFPVIINGNGQKISLSQVSFSLSSDEPNANATFGFSGSFSTSNYVGTGGGANHPIALVGVINGPGGPTYVTSGSGDQLVDELIITGIGNALAADLSTPGTTLQDKLDTVQAQYDALMPFCLTATYSVNTGNLISQSDQNVDFGDDPDCAAVPVPVPEPSSLVMLSLSAATVGLGMRRRRRSLQTMPSSSS